MYRFLGVVFLVTVYLFAGGENKCLGCHAGIEPIRDAQSGMMQAILEKAKEAGYPRNDCIICHGGNPSATQKLQAHKGTVPYFLTNKGPKDFYPAPGSPWINKNTCGMCHEEQVNAQMNSLMMTEQGKIQGTLWSFGGKNGYKHDIGNYKTKNPNDPHLRLGTQAYREYMDRLAKLEPDVFPQMMKELPAAPTAKEVSKDPTLAAYTYLRQECQRCHTGAKGSKAHGDYRGLGCASCHIPYSNSGVYEGNDKAIAKTSGHLLVHAIQSSREAKVTVHKTTYSGVPVETCTTCHNRGKRIGVSYQGLMETAYNTTFDESGRGQPKLHTKKYLHMQEDIHYKKGMLCQDCHTSNDLHGDGFLSGTTLAPVEIECQDCHGTTKAFPWELPLGYSDEFNTTAKTGKARGITLTIAEYLKKGTLYLPKDGYLLSARGNPLTNVVKEGSRVIVHLASGKDIKMIPLKALMREEKLSQKAKVAMDQIAAHTDRLECYTCHATWAPQCYGCHIKIDYSNGNENIDWLKASHDQDKNGRTGDMKQSLKSYLIPGRVTETRSYLRWEDPPLSQNGEGRISPTVPGCQTTISVIGENGRPLLQNHIFKIPNVEGAGSEGQNAIDMSPIQPHTISKNARDCESCHNSAKALGYGINGGKDTGDPSVDTIVELMTADKKIIPANYNKQINKIQNLKNDWSRFIDENGTQLQTVGHHFKLSAPLDEKQRMKLDRSGICLSCHKEMPEGNLGVSLMVHAAKYLPVEIDNDLHDTIVNKSLILTAWVQIVGAVLALIVLLYVLLRQSKKKKRSRY